MYEMKYAKKCLGKCYVKTQEHSYF